eukprot:scaffold1277_cov253-Pinguiococcus_pyrenoidosus.AAC.8
MLSTPASKDSCQTIWSSSFLTLHNPRERSSRESKRLLASLGWLSSATGLLDGRTLATSSPFMVLRALTPPCAQNRSEPSALSTGGTALRSPESVLQDMTSYCCTTWRWRNSER